MFEIIGLLVGSGIFFVLATAVSAILAILTWLSLRNRQGPRKRFITVAVLIPISSVAYMWLCVALLPGESLFGDIAQPLPNGYVLQALGKMPDFASISNPKLPYSNNGPSECIGRLGVYGPLVVGQYSHPFGSFGSNPNEPFFVLDTDNGHHIDLPTLSDLQRYVGHSVTLSEVQYFRSSEPRYLRRQRINNGIEFGPPLIAVLMLVGFVIRCRRRVALPGSQNLYT
jgi:hypothetical protein